MYAVTRTISGTGCDVGRFSICCQLCYGSSHTWDKLTGEHASLPVDWLSNLHINGDKLYNK